MAPTGWQMSKVGMSRSTPSLAAAFSLRQYSLERKRLPPERPSSSPQLDPADLEEIDLIGGNGRWRQMRAKEEFQRRAVEEEERRRRLKILEEEKQRRRAAQAERRRKQLEEERRQVKMEQERMQREKEDKEDRKRHQEERERKRREEEERQWLARQPKPCETCNGGGKCGTCLGKGTIFGLFLAPTVEDRCIADFGRVVQGCDECGGCRQNIIGQLRSGTGKCAVCCGHGKIWPNVTSPKSRRFNATGFGVGGEAGSPKSSQHLQSH